MDRMYRVQRYFYDATRKYYLLGRDELLRRIDPRPDEGILEIGCGTGRNLIKLKAACPEARLFGLDASSAMLQTARENIRKARIAELPLETALAESFTPDTFGLAQLFDKIFFSYSLSMIPDSRAAVANALDALRPGGSLFIVDFYDQAGLPRAAGTLLRKWLSLFGVRYPSQLKVQLGELERNGQGQMSLEPLYRGYSFIACFRKN